MEIPHKKMFFFSPHFPSIPCSMSPSHSSLCWTPLNGNKNWGTHNPETLPEGGKETEACIKHPGLLMHCHGDRKSAAYYHETQTTKLEDVQLWEMQAVGLSTHFHRKDLRSFHNLRQSWGMKVFPSKGIKSRKTRVAVLQMQQSKTQGLRRVLEMGYNEGLWVGMSTNLSKWR